MMGWLHVVILLVVTMLLIEHSETCSCLLTHLQNNYCQADFVMQARLRAEGEYIYKKSLLKVENKTERVEYRRPIDLKYNVKILKMFKVKDNDAGLSKNSTVAVIHTPPNEGMCKVDLELRTKYLLTGKIIDGELWINLCSWGTPWDWVTKSQKKYLRFTYANNCDCKPKIAELNGENVENKACYWRMSGSDGKCFQRHSACIVDKQSSTDGCKWHRNQRIRQCREETKNAKYNLP